MQYKRVVEAMRGKKRVSINPEKVTKKRLAKTAEKEMTQEILLVQKTMKEMFAVNKVDQK